jgi:hypothetical protein
VCCVLRSNFSNVAGEWLAVLVGLPEVSDSSLGAGSGYSDISRCIIQPLQPNAAAVT